MGKICSKNTTTGCNGLCNCFKNDENVKAVAMTRLFNIKWKWTHEHDKILFQSLCDPINTDQALPKAIVNTIKDFTYNAKDEYYIEFYRIRNEFCINSSKALIDKKFCKGWFQTKQQQLFAPVLPINVLGASLVFT